MQIFTRHRVFPLENSQGTAPRVGFYVLVTDLSMQQLFIKPFNTGFTDVVGTRVVDRIDPLQLITVNTADKPQRVRCQLAVGIIADQLCFHFHTGQFVPVHSQPRNLVFGEIIAQRNLLEGPPGLAKTALKTLHIFFGNIENASQLLQRRIHAANPLRHNGHTEHRAIFRQQHLVPIVNQPARRRHRLYLNPVFIRESGVNVVFYYLKLVHPRD